MVRERGFLVVIGFAIFPPYKKRKNKNKIIILNFGKLAKFSVPESCLIYLFRMSLLETNEKYLVQSLSLDGYYSLDKNHFSVL